MDRTVVVLAIIAASPIGLPLVVRALSLRLCGRARLLLAWLSGIVCPAFLGWSIYRSEGPNADTLTSFVSVVVLAGAVSIATIMVAEARSVRE